MSPGEVTDAEDTWGGVRSTGDAGEEQGGDATEASAQLASVSHLLVSQKRFFKKKFKYTMLTINTTCDC